MNQDAMTRLAVARYRRRCDQTRDVEHWIATPLIALLATVLVVFLTGVFFLSGASGHGREPSCAPLPGGTCDEATLSWLAQGTLLFAIVWGALWFIPWWRGLRWARNGVALVAFLIIVSVPVRLVRPEWFGWV